MPLYATKSYNRCSSKCCPFSQKVSRIAAFSSTVSLPSLKIPSVTELFCAVASLTVPFIAIQKATLSVPGEYRQSRLVPECRTKCLVAVAPLSSTLWFRSKEIEYPCVPPNRSSPLACVYVNPLAKVAARSTATVVFPEYTIRLRGRSHSRNLDGC